MLTSTLSFFDLQKIVLSKMSIDIINVAWSKWLKLIKVIKVAYYVFLKSMIRAESVVLIGFIIFMIHDNQNLKINH